MRPETAARFQFAGDQSLLDLPCVAIIGSRVASELGIRRAVRLVRELVAAGVVVVSGLARGIDAAAHREAIALGGRTVAVLGTALEQAYPAEHAALQRHIAEHHLVVSPFPVGTPRSRGNFPARNRAMAALCDATAVVEASEASGTRHQAAACEELGRPLFFCASLANDTRVHWTRRCVGPRTFVLTSTQQILEQLRRPVSAVAL